MITRLYAHAQAALSVVLRELAKFGVVGVVAFLVDVSSFNVLRFGIGDGGPLEDKPLTAKVASVALATVVSWLGNRYWTFRRRRRSQAHREFLVFVVMCSIGLGIALLCLWVSHYILGYTSPLADNISANGVGLVLGTTFRFWAYRSFVFTELRDDVHVVTEELLHHRHHGA